MRRPPHVPLSRRSLAGGLGSLLWLSSLDAARSSEAPQCARLALPPLEDGYKRLYLIRHGETEWNVEGRVQGLTDNPLNENGLNQATTLADYLSQEPIDRFVSSTLQRAASTADAVCAKHPGLECSRDAFAHDVSNLSCLEPRPFISPITCFRATASSLTDSPLSATNDPLRQAFPRDVLWRL